MSASHTVFRNSHLMSNTARSAKIKWPAGPGHCLGEMSLADLRRFYNDPSVIGWRPRPSLDADRFKASFRLEHTIETHYRVGGSPPLIHASEIYRASGSFAPPSSLDFIGTKAGSHKHEICTVGLGADCVDFFRASLLEHSKAHFNKCVSQRQDRPSLITHDFAGGYDQMIERLLVKMLSSDGSEGSATATGAADSVEGTTTHERAGHTSPIPLVWEIVHKSPIMGISYATPGSWTCPGDTWQVEIDYTLHLPSTRP